MTVSDVSSGAGETLVISVHGSAGVLDLVVPVGATSVDVARAYAEQSGLQSIPLLQTAVGEHLRPDLPLGSMDLDAGTMLIAASGVRRTKTAKEKGADSLSLREAPQVAAVAATLAVGAAWLGAWFSGRTGDDSLRPVTALVLLACALAASLPWGLHVRQRVAAAPAFAAAGVFTAFVENEGRSMTAVVAACALGAAATAAVARMLAPRREQATTVWLASGLLTFVVCAVCPLLGWSDRVAWAVLLLVAMLAARFVPAMAVDVPDEAILDLDRLAITAWSARDGARRGRRRFVIPETAMKRLVADSTRTVTAASAAILVAAAVAAPMLLHDAVIDLDVIGARCEVFFVGASLMLVARQYRHVAARRMLLLAGVACWFWLILFSLDAISEQWRMWGLVSALIIGALVVVSAVATGRGWRSVWWSRRAELAESLTGSFALAACVVAAGLFRALWEITS